jgi:hypothetical protein
MTMVKHRPDRSIVKRTLAESRYVCEPDVRKESFDCVGAGSAGANLAQDDKQLIFDARN